MRMKIIINADDLGHTKESNYGILKAFERGYVTQTTLIVNSRGSREGAAIAHNYGFQDKTGLHLNLSEGFPLTDDIKQYSKYVKNGEFCYIPEFMRKESYTKSPLYTYRDSVSSPAFKKEVFALRKELEAQIQRFIAFGFTCRHIDSHCNQLVDLPVWLAVRPLLLRYGFTSIRGIYHSFLSDDIYNHIYATWLQSELQSTGLKHLSYISSIPKYLKYKQRLSGESIIELYVHPVLFDDVLIDNFTGGISLDDNISQLSTYNPYTYFQL